MKDLLKVENLIELHEKLDEFATYHKNKGGQEAHQLIKTEFFDKVKLLPRDGSKEGLLRDSGYDCAIKRVLQLLHKTFVP